MTLLGTASGYRLFLQATVLPRVAGERTDTHVLTYLESLAEQPGACCPGRASFEVFTFLLTSH